MAHNLRSHLSRNPSRTFADGTTRLFASVVSPLDGTRFDAMVSVGTGGNTWWIATSHPDDRNDGKGPWWGSHDVWEAAARFGPGGPPAHYTDKGGWAWRFDIAPMAD